MSDATITDFDDDDDDGKQPEDEDIGEEIGSYDEEGTRQPQDDVMLAEDMADSENGARSFQNAQFEDNDAPQVNPKDADAQVDSDSEEDEEDEEEAMDEDESEGGEPEAKKQKTKKKKKNKNFVKSHVEDGGRIWYAVVDVETTGSLRNFDEIIEIAMVLVRAEGDEEEEAMAGGAYHEFERRVKVKVPVTQPCFDVHGISNDDVKDADDFTVVGNAIGGFINTHITGSDVGVLVAHNGCCDFAFLFSMFQRYKLDFPESLMYTLDTLEHIRRFKIYNDVQLAEWPELTKTGRRSMTVSNICNWIIKRDDIDGTFESLYGGKHEALADARAALQVLTDDDGCWSRIGEHKEVFKILMDEENYWNQMVEKLKEPVIKHEENFGSTGWTELGGDDEFPAEYVEEKPDFKRTTQVSPEGKAGTPSEFFKQSIGIIAGSPVEMTIEALMLAIFFYFFTAVLLGHIVECTNAYATEKINKKGVAGQQQRCKRWETLTVNEFIVFLGIVICMPIFNFRRLQHYWDQHIDTNWRVPEIADSMKANRFRDILSNLSFVLPGLVETDTEKAFMSSHTAKFDKATDPLRKFRFVNEYLLVLCMAAWCAEQYFAIDETMIRTYCRFIPFLQLMKCKPIKCGVKAFGLAFSLSTYYYNWRFYLGKKDPVGSGKGYTYRLIHDHLIPTSFDGKGHVSFADAYFPTFRLICDLSERMVYWVGPTTMSRPKTITSTSFPHQKYNSAVHKHVLTRGWHRQTYRKIGSAGRERLITALTWRDNKFVTMLATTFTANSDSEVGRWDRSASKKIPVTAPLPVVEYNQNMGAVDAVDRSLAIANIRMRRCARRYHRVLFFHLLGL